MLKFRQKLSENTERNPNYQTNTNRVYSYSGVTKRNREDGVSPARNHRTRSSSLSKLQLLIRWILVLSIVGLLLSLLYVSSNKPIVRISSDEIAIKSIEEYENSVAEIMAENILNRTKLTFDYLGFEQRLKELNPEISSVETSFALVGNKLVVRLSLFKPEIIVQSRDDKWIVDGRGVAIADAEKHSILNGSLPLLVDEIGLAIEVGESMLSSEEVELIRLINQVTKEQGIVIDKYTTPLVENQLNVLVAGEQYYTKFNVNEDPKVQVGTWIVARQQFAEDNVQPAEYVDIRASEKVFWR